MLSTPNQVHVIVLQTFPFPDLFGGDLPHHTAPVHKAVVGSQLGQFIQNVAGAKDRNASLPVQLQNKLPNFNDTSGVQAVYRDRKSVV